MLTWTIKPIELKLKYPWIISRGSVDKKTNYLIEVSEDGVVGRGEVAWNARFDESAEDITNGFKEFVDRCPSHVGGVEALMNVFDDMDIPLSLQFGIESAFIHFLAKLSDTPVHELLGVNSRRSVTTAFSLPLMEVNEVKEFIEKHQLARFESLKIKLGGEEKDSDILHEVHKHHKGSLYLDANEAYKTVESFLSFCQKVKELPIVFVEQPLPSSDHEAYLKLKGKSPFPIFADESLTNQRVTEYLIERFDGINVKLQKTGSYFKAIKQMREAKEAGLKVMLGCMVESSLGISSAMNIAANADYVDLDGFLFLEKDPFECVCEESGKLFYADMH